LSVAILFVILARFCKMGRMIEPGDQAK
jgi:hypothetical protein